MRLAAYAWGSAGLAAGALIKAFSQRPNYYSATVYLAQSNACVLILTNLALVCTISFIYGLQRLLYGRLRPVEIEQLSEKAWYAVLDTLLAMPSLRDDVGGWLLVIFVLLLAGKVWGWIAEGRVDLLEQQPPQDPAWFHARLASSLMVSVAFTSFMTKYCVQSVLDNPRPGMMVIFTFEFAILNIFSLFTLARYFLALHEIQITQKQTRQRIDERKAEIREERLQAMRESGEEGRSIVEPTDDDVDENEIDVPGWEEKRRWLFGLELATDFIKIIVYTVFFTISLTFIGLPMHIMRDVYITIANFSKRIQDYSNYRRATEDMNSRYPDATAEELAQDNTCIVCRETMIPWDETLHPQAQGPPRRRMNEGLRAKKLPCNHILHLRCLKAWLERQQACPTCRRPVIPRAVPQARGDGANGPQGVGLLGNANNGQDQPGRPGLPNVNEQQVQQQQARNNRMRWLNMGPVRIGLYNGPAGDVQDALRRQEQIASSSSSRPMTQARLARRTAHLSNQDHIRSVETRLLEQAHNIQVESAQLVHLRALEVELQRLRSLHIEPGTSAQPSSATTAQDANTDTTTSIPTQPIVRAIQVYQQGVGSTSLPFGGQDLPEGLTLPQGWTLVPLHVASTATPQTVAQSAQLPTVAQHTRAEQPASSGPSNAASTVNSTSVTINGHGIGSSAPRETRPQAQQNQSPNAGIDQLPAAELPTTNTTPASRGVPAIPNPAIDEPVPESGRNGTEADPVQPGPSSTTQRGPAWPSDTPTWGFDGAPGGVTPADSNPKMGETSGSTNEGTGQETSPQETNNDEHRAKGKAVQLEDAPDSGA